MKTQKMPFFHQTSLTSLDLRKQGPGAIWPFFLPKSKLPVMQLNRYLFKTPGAKWNRGIKRLPAPS